MKIEVSRTATPETRCPYCLDTLEASDAETCLACDTGLHPECWEESRGCPTPGCSGRPAIWISAPSPSVRRAPRRPRIRCYRCADKLGEEYQVCEGCGWAFHERCYGQRTCCEPAMRDAPHRVAKLLGEMRSEEERRDPVLRRIVGVIALAILGALLVLLTWPSLP